jgi:hypothetical protein
MRGRRALGNLIAVAILAAAVACEAVVNLSAYESGCPAGQKQCPNADGVETCVDAGDPNYGCDPVKCESCVERYTGNHEPGGQEPYSCTNGSCVVAGICPAPWQNCNTTTPYCETDTNTDPANCGNCANATEPGAVCTLITLTSGAQSIGCTIGRCKITECQAGTADCNGVPNDGCEVTLGPQNCWSCPPGSTSPPPPCPCTDCYAGAGGIPSVCPACMSGKTCDTDAEACTGP